MTKTISLPKYDNPEGSITAQIDKLRDRGVHFTSDNSPSDRDRITLTLDDAEADAFLMVCPDAHEVDAPAPLVQPTVEEPTEDGHPAEDQQP